MIVVNAPPEGGDEPASPFMETAGCRIPVRPAVLCRRCNCRPRVRVALRRPSRCVVERGGFQRAGERIRWFGAGFVRGVTASQCGGGRRTGGSWKRCFAAQPRVGRPADSDNCPNGDTPRCDGPQRPEPAIRLRACGKCHAQYAGSQRSGRRAGGHNARPGGSACGNQFTAACGRYATDRRGAAGWGCPAGSRCRRGLLASGPF